ncbi:hypothetical protein [Azospirillum largimobile]
MISENATHSQYGFSVSDAVHAGIARAAPTMPLRAGQTPLPVRQMTGRGR